MSPNQARSSCGALKKDSFRYLRAVSIKRLSGLARPNYKYSLTA